MANKTQADQLAQLRALAQQHLTEIEAEKEQEAAQLSQAETDIQRYAKLPSFDRKNHQSHPSEQQPEASLQAISDMGMTKQKFRPFQDILHRLRWDPELNVDDYVVGYLERFEGIKEMAASNWIRDFSDEEWIPMHRVRYVKRVRNDGTKGSEDHGPELGIVWDRDERIDKISTTVGGGERVVDTADVLSMDGTSVTGGMPL